jgi:hypothetical protein
MRTFVTHDVSELLFRLLFSSNFVVTLAIHVPGMFQAPGSIAPEDMWLWDLYQRSNFIKNVCLLGVCLHLLTHEPGPYTLPGYLQRQRQ